MQLQTHSPYESLAAAPAAAESETPAPVSIAAKPGSPIDRQELLGRCMGRVDLLEKLLSNFDDFLSPQVAELEHAVQMGETNKIRAIAHRLRGAALTISAHELSRCAERLEGAAFDGGAAESANCLEDLLRECERISTAVRTSSARN